jgi:hypothetical protein
MFSGWSGTNGSEVINTDGVYTIVMNGNKSVTAEFDPAGIVTVDGTASSGTGAANATSVSFSHTTGTGTDRLLLVGVSWNCGSTARTISSVTFSGTPLTLVRTEQAGTQLRYSAIYRLLNPPSGVTGNVTVTFSGTVSNGIVAGAANFKGVAQTIPLGVQNGANGNTTSPSVTLTGLLGDELVCDNIFQGATDETQTLTAGEGQTQQWNAWISNTRAAASIEQATGPSVTMSSTAASSSYWAIAAIAINPGPAISYTLTANSGGNGSVTLNPPGGIYPSGTTVTLTPVPDDGYSFSNWTGTDAGDIINTGGVYTIVMNENKSVTANFSMPASGSATSTINPSDATPRVGDQITATVYIDMSGVNSPDNYLGSYTGTLNWNTSVLSYASHTGHPPTGFVGSVNTANASTGAITFNGASIDGATGNILMLTITFNVVGSGSSPLDLAYSAMAATPTTRTLLPILNVTDGQVVVEAPPSCNVVATDGTSSSGTGAPATNSVSFSHTTGTGENRLLLAGVSWNCGTTDRSITSAKFIYGSGPTELDLTPVITYNGYSTANPRYSAIYRYVNPPSGVTGTITITFSGNVSNGIVAGAVNFSGVDQANPLGTAVSAGSGTTQQTTATIDVPTPSGRELVFDNLFFGYSSGQTVTVGSGQSQLWNVNNTATNFNTVGASSIEQTAGSSVTMSWTASTAAYWSLTAVPINPSPTTTTWLGTTSSQWNETSNWCWGVPTASTNVTITAYPVNQPVIPATAECRNLTVNAGASLTIVAGQALTVNGNLISNGTITVESDGASTGSLIVKGTSTGNVTFNRSLNPTGYHYFSSPVELSTLPTPVYEYSEGTDSWISTNTYIKGKGYTISGTGSLSFTGTVITDPVQIEATSPYSDPFTGGGNEYSSRTYVTGRDPDLGGNYGGGGWNLLGNPYTSSINVVDFLTANYNSDPALSSFDPNYVALYLYNGTSYVFVTGDDVTGWTDPNTYDDGIGQLSSAYLQAGQGFFVLAMRNGVSFNFNRDMQEHSTGTLLLKSARTKERWPGLSLKVAGGGTEKRTLVVFNEKMTTGLDPLYDVGQMGSGGAVNIYTLLVDNNGVNFSRQALPENGAVKNVIPVGVDCVKGGSVTFSAETEPLRNYKYWLEDRLTGTFTELGMNSYTVDLPAKTHGTGRFFVHVTAGRPHRSGNQNPDLSQIKIWPAQNREIHIQGNVSEKAICEIYDIHGIKIYETLLTDDEYNVVIVPYHKKGVYVVNVRDGSVVFTQKVVL